MNISALNTAMPYQIYSADQEAIDDGCWERNLNTPENQSVLHSTILELTEKAATGQLGSFDLCDIAQPSVVEGSS